MTSLNKYNHYFTMMYGSMHYQHKNAHHRLKCETPDGKCSANTFKIYTGADGNLMPISMFSELFSQVSLDPLKRTIDRNVMLYGYNKT